MASKIFINYRRDDARDMAARIRDRLASVFGSSNVFMDVDNLMAGQRFDKELEKALSETDVFLAVIGPRWMATLAERRRLDERDYVCDEIAGALKRGITVIPVLIDSASLPRADELPPAIVELVLHQKHGITHEQFGRDASGLAEAIRSANQSKWQKSLRTLSMGRVAAISAIALAVSYIGAHQLGVPVWWPHSSANSRTTIGVPAKGIPIDQFQVHDPSTNGAQSPKRKATEIASNNLIDELVECASYYSLVAESAKTRADGATVTAGYSDAMTQTLLFAAKAGELSGQKPEAVLARFKMQQESHLKTIDRNFSNLAILSQKLLSSCPTFTSNPAPRYQQLVAAAEAEVNGDVARRALQPGRVFRDCDDGCPEMVVVPAGEFVMGSDEFEFAKPPHKVTIGQSFAVGKYEVTFAEWEACVAGGGCSSNKSPSDESRGKGRRPVINVSWYDAIEYVTWLSKKTGRIYRLLSEAEWDYSARAGTSTAFHWGDTFLASKANAANKFDPVGQYPANAFGIHDMHGNVWEWVADRWNKSYQGAPTDGSAWQGGESTGRVLRGGTFDDGPNRFRSVGRYGFDVSFRGSFAGFRIARSIR
ncbi:MAG: SUMF1/EgtB/PvdO family nonheme iron enzyme [Hyphomicrobium sp.]